MVQQGLDNRLPMLKPRDHIDGDAVLNAPLGRAEVGGIVPFAIGSDKAGLNHVYHVFEVSEGIAQVFQMVLDLSGRGFHGPLGRVPVVVAKTDNRLLPPGTNVREHGTDIVDSRLGDMVGIHKVEEIEKRENQGVVHIRVFQAAGGRRDFLRLQFIQFRMLRI